MIYQKGFSLLEVLLSLVLLTTLSLVLLNQQSYSRQWLTQLELRAKASQFLDQIDESLSLSIKRLPLAPHPYHFDAQINQHTSSMQIYWFNSTKMIIRKRSFLAAEVN